jgi:hypothetical protein
MEVNSKLGTKELKVSGKMPSSIYVPFYTAGIKHILNIN